MSFLSFDFSKKLLYQPCPISSAFLPPARPPPQKKIRLTFFFFHSFSFMINQSTIVHASPHQAILIPNNRLILHRSLLARTSRKTLNDGIPFGRNKVRNGVTRWRHTISVSSRRRRRRGRRADAVESRFQNVIAPSLH